MKIYNLFISHAWQYNSDYYNLERNLKEYPGFYFKNYSVPEHDALDVRTDKQLYEALERQIKPVSVVLIIAGMYVNYRRWIQAEIEIAQKYSKPIVVIRPWGAQRIPASLTEVATDVVYWQASSIVSAIRNYSL